MMGQDHIRTRLEAIVASESIWTVAFPVEFVAAGILGAVVGR